MIITIDGPAGTGKSSVAQQVARRLGYDFLDTGAMYRAIGLAAIRRHAAMDDPRELAYVARHSRLQFDWTTQPPTLQLNGQPVSHLLRGSEATSAASIVAVIPAVREQLVREQRQIGIERPNLVTEGRDQGSVVFPDAGLKVYLDATPAERARRRSEQLRARGEFVDPAKLQAEIAERDARDSGRRVGPLVVPDRAQVIDTSELDEPQVVDRIVAMAQARLNLSHSHQQVMQHVPPRS